MANNYTPSDLIDADGQALRDSMLATPFRKSIANVNILQNQGDILVGTGGTISISNMTGITDTYEVSRVTKLPGPTSTTPNSYVITNDNTTDTGLKWIELNSLVNTRMFTINFSETDFVNSTSGTENFMCTKTLTGVSLFNICITIKETKIESGNYVSETVECRKRDSIINQATAMNPVITFWSNRKFNGKIILIGTAKA